MKGNGTWKRWLCAVLAMALISTVPGIAFGAEKPEWRYGESILVEVKVEEPKAFRPDDFSVIDCKKVFVLEKITVKDGVEYQLVLIPGSSDKETLKEDIEKLLSLPIVTHAEKNHKFVTPEGSYLTLNHTCLYLAVGETADVTIKDCYFSDEDRIYGIGFWPDPEHFNMDALQKDSFSEYGITRFWPNVQGEIWTIVMPEKRPEELEAKKSENGYYYGIAGNANEHMFEVVNHMAEMEEFPSVSIVKPQRVGENSYSVYSGMRNIDFSNWKTDSERRFDESWIMENMDVADYTLSGGSNGGPLDNVTRKTAIVQGLRPGITKLTCEESKYDSHAASDCTVIVYEPGSKNNPGDIDHDGKVDSRDALQALKHAAELSFLDEAERQTADLNQDGAVDEKDALLMLEIDVGCL